MIHNNKERHFYGSNYNQHSSYFHFSQLVCYTPPISYLPSAEIRCISRLVLTYAIEFSSHQRVNTQYCVYSQISTHTLHLVEIHPVCNSKMMGKIEPSTVRDSEFRKCNDSFDIHDILSCDHRSQVIQRQDL